MFKVQEFFFKNVEQIPWKIYEILKTKFMEPITLN